MSFQATQTLATNCALHMSNDDIDGSHVATIHNDTEHIVLSDGTVLKWNHNLASLSGTVDIFFEQLESNHSDLFELWTTNAYSYKGKIYSDSLENISFLTGSVKDTTRTSSRSASLRRWPRGPSTSTPCGAS